MPFFDIEPLHADFGARISGVDMRPPLDPETLSAVRAAIDTYSLVVFPDQQFDDDLHLAFTKQLGRPEPSHTAPGRVEYFGTIGNVQPDGTALGNRHEKTIFLTGNNLWHTDASFKKTPAMFSIMSAYETPDEGGETLFVSCRAAYDRLEAAEQRRVDPLVTVHDYTFSRSKVAPVPAAISASLPPVRQKLVRTNPANGRKNLFIGSHVREVEGMDAVAGRRLLDDLVAHATPDEAIYVHRWRPGQLAIWDNRCLLHRGTGYDADKHRRHMRQTRTSGIAPTLEE